MLDSAMPELPGVTGGSLPMPSTTGLPLPTNLDYFNSP